ncbi:ABC transporter substrate-binding protein [Pseudomonas citronellolis]|uniref:ABC transporter substrate-binding protein n=1 Tax=Pseudomonas citronellolis TaxID=53408 RepID=UPI0023E3682B|nr:ABC transporter substrate-binding protein [Pseudomonas citronellolis]MDF3936045.1 ABC transporter substrate-binding protein [Pseudomonas citronellolis]
MSKDIDKLLEQLRQGRIDRRGFMFGMLAVGASAALAGSYAGRVLAADGTPLAAPKRGGHFKLGIASGSTTDSFDPGTYGDNYMQSVGHSVHNFLTEVSNSGELVGELAESWEPSPDARVWTFKLRQGVTFHNGKSLEAADVVASLNHHRGPDSKSAASSILAPIADIRADGKDTVVVTLNGGNADFPYLVSDYHLPVMPSQDGKVDATSGVGCGAYIRESFDPGVKTVVKRNPNYWKRDRGWFDSVEFLVIADVGARTNALNTGEIHAMNGCDLKTLHLLKRNPRLEISSIKGGQHYSLPMDTRAELFRDNNVRLALKHAVDRKALLQTILRGHGEVANDHPISPGYRFFAADLPQREYDPDKARFYLKQAGLSSLKVDLSAADAAFAGAVDTAVLVREHAAKAGIEVNVVREPNDGYWKNVWMKKPWCMDYWGGKPTEDWAFSLVYGKGASWNETFWDNPRFNQLLLGARSELDEAKRRQMYGEMQGLLRDEGGALIPLFANYVDGISTQIGHDKLGNNWDLDGLRAAERWWFA